MPVLWPGELADRQREVLFSPKRSPDVMAIQTDSGDFKFGPAASLLQTQVGRNVEVDLADLEAPFASFLDQEVFIAARQ
jgi:hypothetical protein